MKQFGPIDEPDDVATKDYVDTAIAGVGDSALSSVTAATAANTIANANYKQTWQWQLSGDTQGLVLTESVASTGGTGPQSILMIDTLSGSTANPLLVKAKTSNILYISSGGHVHLTAAGAYVANTAGAAVNIRSGAGSGTGAGGALDIYGGDGGTAGSAPGLVTISGGNSAGGNGNGGTIAITCGLKNGTGVNGSINLVFGTTGTLKLDGAVGTAGQVLTSNGTNLAPTWSTIPAPSFASITSKPTTIAGYGITDAVELPIAQSDVTNLTTDLAAKANKAQRVAVTYSATPDFDLSLGSVFDITLTGAASYTFSNPTDGQKIIIRWRQDETGSRVITHPANVRFGTDLTAAVLGTTASKTDYIGYVYNAQDNKYDLIAFTKGF